MRRVSVSTHGGEPLRAICPFLGLELDALVPPATRQSLLALPNFWRHR